MKKWIFAIAIIVIVLLGFSAGAFVLDQRKATTQSVNTVVTAPVIPKPPTRAELLKLVNVERAKYHIAPLKEDARLNKSAQYKAEDEVKYHYFSHVSPHDGKQGFLYINDVGIYCRTDSENIAEIWPITANQAVKLWVESPPHHKAMINPAYSLTGFGIKDNQIVEHFCQQ